MSSPSPELNIRSFDIATFDVLQHSLLIRAGAGAGKTTTLINTFITLCEEFEKKWNRLPRVAITTFTRKATQEVKERLSVKALEKKDEKLFQHINKKSAVHISTIHGLLTLFVQENADALGLPQNIKIIDQNLNKKNLKKTIRHLLKKQSSYLEILEHYSFARLVDLLSHAVEVLKQSPDVNILSIQDLQKITEQKFSTTGLQLKEILQYESSAPENWAEYFSYLKHLEKLATEKKADEILTAIENEPAKPRWNKKKPVFLQEGHDLIEKFWKDFDISIVDTESYFQQHAQLNHLFLQMAHNVYALDQNRKKTSGQITINDLELFSLELVRHHSIAVDDFSNHFDYYMIDEFQDTSPIQVEILDALICKKPHFIVGDPQQSIYLFRGARSEVFYLKQKLAAANTTSLKLNFLDINYRSQPSLMLFINDYFGSMGQSFEPMKTNPEKDRTKAKIIFVQALDEAAATLLQISNLLNEKVSPKEICILSRKNSNLMKISSLAQKLNIPVQLQMSAGFDQKREILDLIAMLKFLVNPHDNENLILLLRSPWAYLADEDIAVISAGKERSLWYSLNQKFPSSTASQRLNNYFNDYQKIGVSESLMNLIKLSGFLDFSSVYDASGKREANFWKFLVHLKNAETLSGFSLGQYLGENFQFLQSDLGSSQAEAIPVDQPDRVSLMTIHAAKGLEFNYVVIVGFSEEPLLTKLIPLTFEVEEKKISLAPHIISESKTVASRWAQNIRRDFNNKEHAEYERLLYVAMTRAKKGLILIAKDKSRKSNSSWKSKSIWPEIGENIHEHYDLISLAMTSDIQPRSKIEKETAVQVRKQLQLSSKVESSLSVTESLGSISTQASTKINYESKIMDLLKAKKGTEMHRLFESLQVYSNKPELLENLHKNSNSEQKRSIYYLLNLKEIPLSDLIKFGFTEWGFGIKTKLGVLQGQIDLWGIVGDQIYVLDYKTGSTAFAEKGFQQLLFYSYCLYKMKMISFSMKINLVVIYPLEEKVLVKSFNSFDFFEKSVPVNIIELF